MPAAPPRRSEQRPPPRTTPYEKSRPRSAVKRTGESESSWRRSKRAEEEGKALAFDPPPSIPRRKRKVTFSSPMAQELRPVEEKPPLPSIIVELAESRSTNTELELQYPPRPSPRPHLYSHLPPTYVRQRTLPPSPPLVPLDDPYHPVSNFSLPRPTAAYAYHPPHPSPSNFTTLISRSSPDFLRSDAPSPPESPITVEEFDCHKLLDLLESFIATASPSELAFLSSPSFLSIAPIPPSLSAIDNSTGLAPVSASVPSTPPSATRPVDPSQTELKISSDGRAELLLAPPCAHCRR